MPAHFFLIEDLGLFISNLELRGYTRVRSDSLIEYHKTISGVLTKYYAYSSVASPDAPIQVRVTYKLLGDGKALQKLAKKLKELNYRYRKTLPGWKTKREPSKRRRDFHWHNLESFLNHHSELIACFKYEGDNRLTEGNYSFNLQVASTPKEQAICLDFIRAIAEAHAPYGIVRRRREADRPIQQRNGWIRRYAQLHKKRGWGPLEIAREIQKELRNGTWNERTRFQFNIANNTICKIAGLKIPRQHSHFN